MHLKTCDSKLSFLFNRVSQDLLELEALKDHREQEERMVHKADLGQLAYKCVINQYFFFSTHQKHIDLMH